LLREARASSALNHPNIVTVYDIGSENGIDYIAMEYVNGETLRQAFSGQTMSITGKLSLALQISEALTAAHDSGIIHRDLKPGNIMLSAAGQIKVLDFGLARRAENAPVAEDESVQRPADTRTGVIAGTFAYMSPEQAQGLKADARSDIFSFGAVLYEMFTGSRPFAGNSSMEVVVALLEREPVSPAQLRPDLPKELSPILRKALAKKPSERYQRMRELSADLEGLRQRLELSAPAARPATHKTQRVWAALAAAVILIVMTVLAGQWPQRDLLTPFAFVHRRAAVRELIDRSGTGVVLRWDDRDLDHRAYWNSRTEGDLTDFRDAIQENAQAAEADRQRAWR
jgi:serine/threonine protein kinase